MVWVPDWLKPRARRVVGLHRAAPESVDAVGREVYTSATNAARPLIEIVRPHLATGRCLIVTDYQDFFSPLAQFAHGERFTRKVLSREAWIVRPPGRGGGPELRGA